VLPFIVVTCIGGPMLASWELRPSMAALRHGRLLAEMRRHLDRPPETEHPLGG
jgi:hypothetical protein